MPRIRHLTIAALGVGSIISLGFATQPEECAPPKVLALHEMMGLMAEAKDALGEALEAKDSQAALRELEIIQENTIGSKSQIPDAIFFLKVEDRPVVTASYRMHLVGVLQTLCEIEVLIIEEDFEAATTMLNYTLFDQQRDAHDNYLPKSDP